MADGGPGGRTHLWGHRRSWLQLLRDRSLQARRHWSPPGSTPAQSQSLTATTSLTMALLAAPFQTKINWTLRGIFIKNGFEKSPDKFGTGWKCNVWHVSDKVAQLGQRHICLPWLIQDFRGHWGTCERGYSPGGREGEREGVRLS